MNRLKGTLKEKDNLIFLHKFLNAIADSLIKVFVPLYLLKQTDDIFIPLIYLILFSSFVFLLMVIFQRFLKKKGPLAILLHFIPIIIAQALLGADLISLPFLVLIAFLMAIGQAFYSVPLNIVFAYGDKKANVGKFQIPQNIGKLLFTLISGILLANVERSFLGLAIVSSLLYILSSIPLLFTYQEMKIAFQKEEEEKKKKNLVQNKYPFWYNIFHFCFGIYQPVMDNLLPLFLYVNSLSFSATTIFVALVEALKIPANMAAQFLVRKKKELLSVCFSFCLYVVSLALMVFLKNPVALYVLSTLCSLSFPFTFVPMFGSYSEELKTDGKVFDGMTNRDYLIFIGRPALYSLVFLGLGLLPSMIAGASCMPLSLLSEIFIIRDKRKKEAEQ